MTYGMGGGGRRDDDPYSPNFWGSPASGPNTGVLELQRENIALREKFRAMQDAASYVAVIAKIQEHHGEVWATAIYGVQVLEARLGNHHSVGDDIKKLSIGDGIRIAPNEKGQLAYAGVARDHFNAGPISSVKQIVSPTAIEVDSPMNPAGTRVVACAVDKYEKRLKRGVRVVLDVSGSVVVGIAKEEPKNEHLFETDTGISWDDIGGNDEAKEELREAIEMPAKHAKLYKKYGRSNAKGILLCGPPGCGKTLLSKAACTALRDASGKGAAFFAVSGSDFVSKYTGEGEQRIKALFESARKHERDTGLPAVIFIDEVDAIAGVRGDPVFTHVERKLVPALLEEMDGFSSTKTLVILATNRPDQLDPAITRHKRMDLRITVKRPDKQACGEIFKIHMHHVPVAKGSKKAELIDGAVESVFQDESVISDYQMQGIQDLIRLRLRDVVSGAMVAGIVDRAAKKALRRDRASESDETCGVTIQDFETAIRAITEEERLLNHQEDVERLVRR